MWMHRDTSRLLSCLELRTSDPRVVQSATDRTDRAGHESSSSRTSWSFSCRNTHRQTFWEGAQGGGGLAKARAKEWEGGRENKGWGGFEARREKIRETRIKQGACEIPTEEDTDNSRVCFEVFRREHGEGM